MHAAINALHTDDEDLAEQTERFDARLDDLEGALAEVDGLHQAITLFRLWFTLHAKRRIEVLYPALDSHRCARATAREGAEELELASALLDRMEAGPDDAETVIARGRVLIELIELIERHLEKEDDELLPRVRKLSASELDQLDRGLASIGGDAHGEAHQEAASR
ncbi:MAG: hypothetical protein H0W72_15975 [Planctomycetes bacterium]|nr:hypothetical protein [Planctomycetota bacterium]